MCIYLLININMILIYILSILSISSLFMEKIQPVQINPVEENNTIEVKTISKPQKIQTSEQTNSWINEIDLQDTNTENQNIQYNEDEYEEIIFQDDFDKEYRMGTEDNYLEE